jgi:hypothetical protein
MHDSGDAHVGGRDRARVLSDDLRDAPRPDQEIRIALEGNPPTSGVPDFAWHDLPIGVRSRLGPIAIRVEPLPEGHVRANVSVALGIIRRATPHQQRSIPQVAWDVLKALVSPSNYQSPAEFRRLRALEAAGWKLEGDRVATQTFDVDPSDLDGLDQVIAEIDGVLASRQVPLGLPWSFRVVPIVKRTRRSPHTETSAMGQALGWGCVVLLLAGGTILVYALSRGSLIAVGVWLGVVAAMLVYSLVTGNPIND